MCKANSFLLGVLPDIKIMVAERERVRGLVQQPAHPKVSLSRPTATGGDEEMLTQNYPSERNNSDAVVIGPRRPSGNVGQQAKNSAQPYCSQARKMPFVLN
jgi:hypothetical protein